MADITGSITKIRTSDNSEHYINAKYWDGHEWGELASALKYCGITTTKLTDGATTNPVVIGDTNHTATAGCVVFYEDTEGGKSTTKEFVFNGSKWELLGGDSTYKVIQSTVSSPNADGSAMAFIDTISQDANGVITVTKKYCKKQYRLEYTATESLGNLDPFIYTDSVFHEYDTSTGKGAFVYEEAPTRIVIQDSAFRDCTSLTSITIPDSITNIGNFAFEGCSNLTSVTIPDSVTSIGWRAFYKCTSLTSITIPDSVTSIEYMTFEDCTSLTSVTIGNSVTSIGMSAIAGCTSLTSITIPDSVTNIANTAFAGCDSLISVTIGDGVTTIGEGAFSGCDSLISVTIPDSVITIGESVFYFCRSLTSVTIGDGVTSIGEKAFYNCTSLKNVIIGKGIISIGESAFKYCNMTSVSIRSENVPDLIGDWFYNGNVSKIYVPINSLDAYKTAINWSDYADRIIGCVFEDEHLVSGENIKTINGESIIGKGDIKSTSTSMVEITWVELKKLRDNSQLIPGLQYRIIDYVTTTTQANTLSAGHQFDIIVTADTNNVLNENARACLHKGDIYFSDAGAKLESWQIKYCLDNDKDKFAWAKGIPTYKAEFVAIYWDDPVNGENYDKRIGNDKIYDWGTVYDPELGYDNIVIYKSDENIYIEEGTADYGDKYFYRGVVVVDGIEYDSWKKWDATAGGWYHSQEFDGYQYAITERIVFDNEVVWQNEKYAGRGVIYNMIDEHNNECPYDFKNIMFFNEEFYNYVYTFNWVSSSDVMMDISILGNNGTLYDDDGLPQYSVYGNIIKPYSIDTQGQLILNNIVFVSSYHFESGLFYGNMRNIFGYNCHDNTFGDSCSHNTFGDNCSMNTFGDSCSDNTFGDNCYYNTFDNTCYYNTFGNNCEYNIFGYGCHNNTFGNKCFNNTFGYNCHNNTFDNSCYHNTFGSSCFNNTFGNKCFNNTFGYNCHNNTFGNNCISNSFVYMETGDFIDYVNNVHFGDGCRYIELGVNPNSVGTINSTNSIKNIDVAQGLGLNFDTPTQIELTTAGQDYEIKVAINSAGDIKVFCLADLIA